MNFVKSLTSERGIEDLTRRIVNELKLNKKILWLVSGGSNIQISVKVMECIRKDLSDKTLANLTVSIVDERYGEVGHKDSNWKQLIDAGFDFNGISFIPVLNGMPIDKAVTEFQKNIREEFKESDCSIAQIGIGSDGHIAGILPKSPAVRSERMVCAYESAPYERITISPRFLEKIDAISAFAFGESKKKAVSDLQRYFSRYERDGVAPSDEEMMSNPSLLLINAGEMNLYSDQI